MEAKPFSLKLLIMKDKLQKKIIILLAGIIAGTVGGYLYYVNIGCSSGGCAITSNPWMSIAFGGLFGYYITDAVLVHITRKKNASKRG